MKIKLAFENKKELNSFYTCLIEMIGSCKHKMNWLTYFNSLQLIQTTQKKAVDMVFKPTKKVSLFITPNHFSALNFVYTHNWHYLKDFQFTNYLLIQRVFEDGNKQNERLENINFNFTKTIEL